MQRASLMAARSWRVAAKRKYSRASTTRLGTIERTWSSLLPYYHSNNHLNHYATKQAHKTETCSSRNCRSYSNRNIITRSSSSSVALDRNTATAVPSTSAAAANDAPAAASSSLEATRTEQNDPIGTATARTSTMDAIPSSSGLSCDDVWRGLTERILSSSSSSSFAASSSHQSEQQLDATIQWWVRQRPFTTEAAHVTWQLLDSSTANISDKNSKHDKGNTTTTTTTTTSTPSLSLLKRVLDHWRLCDKESTKSKWNKRVQVPYTPQQVWTERMKHRTDLDVRTYSIFLSALAQQGTTTSSNTCSIELAEQVVQHAIAQNNPIANNAAITSSVVFWNSVLTVYTKAGAGGPATQAVFDRMTIEGFCEPNEISYACVLQAWADDSTTNSISSATKNENAQHAQRLLQTMVDTLGAAARADPARRDAHASACYLQVLRAFINTGTVHGVHQARDLLAGMVAAYVQEMSAAGSTADTTDGSNDDTDNSSSNDFYPQVLPTRHCFSAVMSGYARLGQPDQVESLLAELQRLSQASSLSNNGINNKNKPDEFMPTIATFNSVLKAYAGQATPASAQKAQDLLERLSNHMSATCRPDATTVNTCISAWAASGAPDAVDRAQALLSWPGMRPDTVSYTSVIKAWARSNRPDAAQGAQNVLREMWERHDEATSSHQQHQSVKPNAVTYATVLYAWAQPSATKPRDAPQRAERVYHDLLERYNKSGGQDASLKPSASIYVSLIFAWAFSEAREGDMRAQLYFDQMRGRFLAGDESLRPGPKVYNALISSKKQRHDGPGAEMILKLMYSDLQQGNQSAQPNRQVFHNVMTSWATSKDARANQKIEELLFHMKKEHETKKWDVKPNKVSFTILLNCLANMSSGAAAERAESILQHMHTLSEAGSGDETVKPCSYCYATVLNAWTRASKDSPHAGSRALALYETMWERVERGELSLRPNSYAYNSVLTALAKNSSYDTAAEDMSGKALVILNEMEARNSLDPTVNEPPGPFHYTAVISAFAGNGNVSNAERLLERMLEKGLDPHRTTLNALMNAYAKSNLGPEAASKAHELLYSMKRLYSTTPDVVTYSTYLVCLQKSQVADAYPIAKTVVEEMMARGRAGEVEAKPNVSTFGTLVLLLRQTPDDRIGVETKAMEAESIARLMDRAGVQPTPGILDQLENVQRASQAQ